jgi:hypothetical protein
LRGAQAGAVTFLQRFSSALALNPHLHSVVPDGVWVEKGEGARFVPLPPPTQEEVERLVAVVRHRVLRLLERRGVLPAEGPENALEALQAASLQQQVPWAKVEVRAPPRSSPRCAQLEGFSPHANTHLHANDRQGLERLCRYGARGALALERLTRLEARLDQATLLKRSFDFDVFTCRGCGGRRRVLAVLRGPGVKEVLRHLGWPTVPLPLASARGRPQGEWLH